jgi:hypothetical protein
MDVIPKHNANIVIMEGINFCIGTFSFFGAIVILITQ